MEQENLCPPTFPAYYNALGFPNFNVPPPPLVSPPPPHQWHHTNWNQFNQPYSFTVPPPIITRVDNVGPKDVDKAWINNWLQEVHLDNNKRKPKQVQISAFKEKLKRFSTVLMELESLHNCMNVLKKTLDKPEWFQRCNSVYDNKKILLGIASEIDFEVSEVKNLLLVRKKKRNREKQRKMKMYRQLQETKLTRENEHKKIDMWLDKMKEEVERAKREEQVKAEADAILSEVTLKKSEAKRTLTLLSTLNKLRNARVQAAVSRGVNISNTETETFTQIIGRLKKYWVDQLNEYNLEEQGLRVMLNHAEVERSDVALTLRREILNEWSEAIFGSPAQEISKFEPKSIDSLIHRRCAWDKYVCFDRKVMVASKIPIGWVIPTGPTNQYWAKLLKS